MRTKIIIALLVLSLQGFAQAQSQPRTHSVPAGGTTGQSLQKASNTDYDLTWGSGSGFTSRNLWGQVFDDSANIGGAIELGTVGTTDTTVDRDIAGSIKVEGNPIPTHFFIRAASTVTQSNDANPHPIFTTPTNGRVTLPTGVYVFRGYFAWTAMSATAGNLKIDILGSGTATTTAWNWGAWGADAAVGGAGAAVGGSYHATSASNTNIINTSTSTGLGVFLTGTVDVSGTGTFIPTQTLANAAAAVLSVGSYFEIWRVGATGSTSVGPWD